MHFIVSLKSLGVFSVEIHKFTCEIFSIITAIVRQEITVFQGKLDPKLRAN